MLSLHEIVSIMTRPGNVVFPENRSSLDALIDQNGKLVASPHALGTVWHPPSGSPKAGPRVLITQAAHAIFYGTHGHRILSVDPGGTPLHEGPGDDTGSDPNLLYARRYQDWG